MIRRVVIACVVAAAAGSSVLHAQPAGDSRPGADARVWANCRGGGDVWSDLRVTACSDLIRNGKASGADLARAHYYRGNAYLVQGDYYKANDDYSRAIDIDPNNASALHERCWVRGVLSARLEDALADCNESLRLKPNDGETLAARGYVYLRLGFYRTSVLDYDAALAARPNTAEYLYGRALARSKLGDRDGAERDFAAARAADPKVDETYARYDEVRGTGVWGTIAGYWRAMMKWVY